MKELKWNKQWKFWPDKDSFALVWDIPENAREITLPHDAMIENPANPDSLNGGNTGFRDAECYTYVKMLFAPEEYKNQTVMIKFEGVYMNAFVYVNGQLAEKSPFGYTTFYLIFLRFSFFFPLPYLIPQPICFLPFRQICHPFFSTNCSTA